MSKPTLRLDGTRGLTQKDLNALESLQIFLEDHKVENIDVEPKEIGAGFTIKAMDRQGTNLFESWGANIREAVTNLVRSVVR